MAQTVQGYTLVAAAAAWRGLCTGQIAPGFSGDPIILDRDILTCDRYAIAETQVLLTLFKGREGHQHPSFG